MVIDSQMNPDKYTQEQLDVNATDTYATYAAAYAAAYDAVAYYAAYYAYAAAHAVAAYYANANSDKVEGCLDTFFRITGESKQDYIDAINKDNK